MNLEELWAQYNEVKYLSDIDKMIQTLTKCIEQTQDPFLARSAKRDLGLIYTADRDDIRDMEKAERYLKEAAAEGDENAKLFMGNILYNEGKLEGLYWYAEAMEVGNIRAAYYLWDNYTYRERTHDENNYMAKRAAAIIDSEMERIYNSCMEEIENGEDEGGVPQFALALMGLYDLGKNFEIDRKKGKYYMEEAARLGNPYALFMKENPAVMKPETINDWQIPTAEELRRMDKQLTEEHLHGEAACEEESSKKGWNLFGVLWFLVKGIFKLCWMAVRSILAGFGEALNGSSSSSAKEFDPMEKLKQNQNCNNMPSCIYDEKGNRWDKSRSNDDYATYENFDLGSDEIGYCNIEHKSATGRRGSYHWY